MREIKFRSWLKERKILSEVLIINYKDSTVQLPIETDVTEDYWWDETTWSFDEVELMQYTGLKDKNGKEIYEGDIVEIKFITFEDNQTVELEYNVVYKVNGFWVIGTKEEQSNEIFKGMLERNMREELFYMFLYEWLDNLEVVGNVYENAELINK